MTARPFLLLFLILSSIRAMGAGIPSTFRTDVRTDGLNLEWTSPLPRYDKKTGINYDVANDDRRFCLILRIADEKIQQQLLKNGLEIWIDKEGGKARITGVTFPLPLSERARSGAKKGLPGTREKRPSTPVGQGFTDKEKPDAGTTLPRISPDMVETLKLTGFFIENGIQPASTGPVRACMNIDASGCLVYELEIPFNTFFTEKIDANTPPTAFGLTFLIRADEASEDSNMPPMGMMGGPGGMMDGPDGPPPGMMPYGTSSGTSVFMEKKNRVKIDLALHP